MLCIKERFIYKLWHSIKWLVEKFFTLYSENQKFEYCLNLLLTALSLGFAIWLISIKNPFCLGLAIIIIVELVLAYIKDFVTFNAMTKGLYETQKK